MTVHLTASAIDAATRKARETRALVELVDSATAGLRLRCSARGRRAWVLATRDTFGRLRRFPVGEYPAMGIAEARGRASVVRSEIKGGADPVAEARRRRQSAREGVEGIATLADLLAVYETAEGSRKKSWPEQKARIESVFGKLLRKPLATVALVDFQLVADRWPAISSASAACRYLGPILKWASAPGRGYVSATMTGLRPPAAPGRRDRILSRDELSRLLPVLKASARPYAACLRLILLTLVRREEAAGARWRDIDLEAGIWTIAETKNGQPHAVPLSCQARALLASLKPDGADPLALVFATRTGERLGNFDKETRVLQAASGTEGWTRHDLRRTGATMLGEMGELPDIVEAALNHVAIRSRLAATYNRSRYRPQVAAALQRLADALDGIEAGAAEVVPLEARR
ncbi:tyrosine-type recombinase/integrase [Acidisoma sp. C75]